MYIVQVLVLLWGELQKFNFLFLILQQINYHYSLKSSENHFESLVLAKTETRGCEAYQNKDLWAKIEVPPTPPVDLSYTSLIRVQYYLEVSETILIDSIWSFKNVLNFYRYLLCLLAVQLIHSCVFGYQSQLDLIRFLMNRIKKQHKLRQCHKQFHQSVKWLML